MDSGATCFLQGQSALGSHLLVPAGSLLAMHASGRLAAPMTTNGWWLVEDGSLCGYARVFFRIVGHRGAMLLAALFAWCKNKMWLPVVAGAMQDGGGPCGLAWRRQVTHACDLVRAAMISC
jgi:hypothetical protein